MAFGLLWQDAMVSIDTIKKKIGHRMWLLLQTSLNAARQYTSDLYIEMRPINIASSLVGTDLSSASTTTSTRSS
jgi:hypothetical protein